MKVGDKYGTDTNEFNVENFNESGTCECHPSGR